MFPTSSSSPSAIETVRTVSFQAGFASDLGHLVVWSLAGLVKGWNSDRHEYVREPTQSPQPMDGTHRERQGRNVRDARGRGADGAPLRIDWNLIAEQNHGPHIPCGAAIALARKIGSGASLPTGAMPCVGLLTVDEFLEPLRDLSISEKVA